MIDKILSALRAENIGIYTVNETRSQSAEAFFVRRNMDLKRRTTLTDYTVTVFRELEKNGVRLLGSSTVPVYPGMSEAELSQCLRGAYFAASFAGNPYYELISGAREPHVPSKSAFAGMTPAQAVKLMGHALFEPDTQEDVFVNSAEIFAIHRSCRVINSRGVDVSWDTCEVRGEYVIQCPQPRDVETYHSFSFLEPDTQALSGQVRRALSRTRDRAMAENPPRAGEYTVILTDEHLREIFSYYLFRAGAGAVYQHYSDYAVGAAVQGEDIQGDRLTIHLAATQPYDSEGIRLVDRPLMEDGILKTIHGGARFSGYLGITPTGAYDSIRVKEGGTELARLMSQPHLHVVTFSDFQMNPMSGHFAGEIRLAYLFDGEKTVPVTGGSINGSLLEAQRTLRLSKERYVSADYSGPMAVALKGVTVAGG